MKFPRTLLLSLSCLIFDANIALGNEANMPFKDEASRKPDPICEHMIAKAGADLLRGFKKYGFDQIAEHIINCYNDEFEHIITKSKNPSVIQRLIKNDHVLQKCRLEDESIQFFLYPEEPYDPDEMDNVNDSDDSGIKPRLNTQYFYDRSAASRRYLFDQIIHPHTSPTKNELNNCLRLYEDVAEPTREEFEAQVQLQEEQNSEYGWMIRALKKHPHQKK